MLTKRHAAFYNQFKMKTKKILLAIISIALTNFTNATNSWNETEIEKAREFAYNEVASTAACALNYFTFTSETVENDKLKINYYGMDSESGSIELYPQLRLLAEKKDSKIFLTRFHNSPLPDRNLLYILAINSKDIDDSFHQPNQFCKDFYDDEDHDGYEKYVVEIPHEHKNSNSLIAFITCKNASQKKDSAPVELITNWIQSYYDQLTCHISCIENTY